MKTKIILCTAILAIFVGFTSVAQISWQKCFGGLCGDGATSIDLTSDSCYIVAGFASLAGGDVSGNHGLDDIWVIKVSTTGNLLWQKCIGGSKNDGANSIQQTADSGYVVAGYANSDDGDFSGNKGASDACVTKLDASGNIEWAKLFGGDTSDIALSIQQTSDGGYIVAGGTLSTNGDVTANHGYSDCWLLKLSSSGIIEWQKCFGSSGNDQATCVRITNDGGYIVAGTSEINDGDVSGNHGLYDFWIFKLSSSGSMQWQKSYGGSSGDIARSIQQTADGGYIVAGNADSYDGDITGNHGNDAWIIKLNGSGNLEWQKCLGGSNIETATCILQSTDGGYFAGGRAYSNDGDLNSNFGQSDFWLVKITPLGIINWQKNFGGSQNDIMYDVKPSNDGGYIMAGYTESNDMDVSGNNSGADIWLVKLDAATEIEEQMLKEDIMLYPNPASNIITIDLPYSTSIDLFNVQGKIIKSVIAGENATSIDVSTLESGLYFVKINMDAKILVRKFVKQ